MFTRYSKKTELACKFLLSCNLHNIKVYLFLVLDPKYSIKEAKMNTDRLPFRPTRKIERKRRIWREIKVNKLFTQPHYFNLRGFKLTYTNNMIYRKDVSHHATQVKVKGRTRVYLNLPVPCKKGVYNPCSVRSAVVKTSRLKLSFGYRENQEVIYFPYSEGLKLFVFNYNFKLFLYI